MAFSPLALEELRAAGDQRFYQPDAVRAGATLCNGDLALSLGSVAVLWLDQVEVQVGAGWVNVGITGIGFLDAFVVALNVADLRALVFCESHNSVLVAHGFLLYVSIFVDNPRFVGNWWYHICDFLRDGFHFSRTYRTLYGHRVRRTVRTAVLKAIMENSTSDTVPSRP